MITMNRALAAWGSERFETTLREEMEGLRGGLLPLEQAIGEGNRVYDHDMGVTVMSVRDEGAAIGAHVGVFFAEVVSCCSCGEGEPIEEAYCEMRVSIDKASGEARFSILDGQGG